jgi:ribonuclease Y
LLIDTMPELAFYAAGGIVVALTAAAFFIFGRRFGRASELAKHEAAKTTAEQNAARILDDARRESETIRKSAVVAGKEELIRLREDWETEAKRRRDEVEREERRLQEKESVLDRKLEVLEQREEAAARQGRATV